MHAPSRSLAANDAYAYVQSLCSSAQRVSDIREALALFRAALICSWRKSRSKLIGMRCTHQIRPIKILFPSEPQRTPSGFSQVLLPMAPLDQAGSDRCLKKSVTTIAALFRRVPALR